MKTFKNLRFLSAQKSFGFLACENGTFAIILRYLIYFDGLYIYQPPLY